MAKITLLRSTTSYNRQDFRHQLLNSNNRIMIACIKQIRIILIIFICRISKVKS